MLVSGMLERRGFIDHKGVNLLLDYLLDATQEESKRVAAARVLATCAFPEEITTGIRDIIFQRGGFQHLLNLASTEKITVYHEIDPAELTMDEQIAEGASGRVYLLFMVMLVKTFHIRPFIFHLTDTREHTKGTILQ